QVRRGGARRSRRREAGESLGRAQVVRAPGGRDRRAHALRARDAAPRPGRRAAGDRREDRPRPQPGRPGRDLVRVDPDQPGVRRAAVAAVALLALARGVRAADPPGSPRANQALAVCLADAATPAERRANLARGPALAEEAGAALRVDPDFVKAHLGLARALAARGVRDEARAEARRALAAAERAPDPAKEMEARDLLAQLAE